MTMTRFFTTHFDPILFPLGFKRKRNGYYRLLNGEILQAIVLKQVNPYMVCYVSFPFWLFNFSWFINSSQADPMKKNYWMEGDSIYSYKGELLLTYYRDGDDEQNERDIAKWIDLTHTVILPYLDQMNSFEVYADKCIQDNLELMASKKGGPKINGKPMMNGLCQYILLYLSYKKGSFDFAKDYIAKYRHYLTYYGDVCDLMNDYRGEVNDAVHKGVERMMWCHFRVLEQKIAENDLDWIYGVYKSERNRIGKMIVKDLKLKVSDLDDK